MRSLFKQERTVFARLLLMEAHKNDIVGPILILFQYTAFFYVMFQEGKKKLLHGRAAFQPLKKKFQTKANKISNAEMPQRNSNKVLEGLFIYDFNIFH